MGFRDLSLMNSALLAKQAWSLLKKPDCLWGKCLKQMYHPAEDFMHVKRSRNVSWSWSSLLHGRDIIQKHCQWFIANGEKVYVKEDKWLIAGQPVCTKEGAQITRVSDLIQPNTRSWDLQKFKDNLVVLLRCRLFKHLSAGQL